MSKTGNLVLIAGVLAAGLAAGLMLAKKNPTITGQVPSPAQLGDSWTFDMNGFAPNSQLTVICTKCGSNASPITQCVGCDTTPCCYDENGACYPSGSGCVYTDANGNAKATSIIGSTDFGEWELQVCDTEGNCSPMYTYVISS